MSTPQRTQSTPLPRSSSSFNTSFNQDSTPGWAPFSQSRLPSEPETPWDPLPPPLPVRTLSGTIHPIPDSSPLQETPSKPPRAKPLSDEGKVDFILRWMRTKKFTLSKFLYLLFQTETAQDADDSDDNLDPADPSLRAPPRTKRVCARMRERRLVSNLGSAAFEARVGARLNLTSFL